MRFFLLTILPLMSSEGFELVSVKDIFLVALEGACRANVSLENDVSAPEACSEGVLVSPTSMPVAPRIFSGSSRSTIGDAQSLKLQVCMSVQRQRSNENDKPAVQATNVVLARKDSATGQFRLPLVLNHPLVSRNSFLPPEVHVELCIAVLRVSLSEPSSKDQHPEFWPSTTNAITWCGAPAGSDSSVADILVPETGRYLAAAMLITVQPVDHANVLPAEAEESWDGISGPTHLLDLHLQDSFLGAETLHTEASASFQTTPSSSNVAKWTFAPPIAFVLGGFPKTGTSTLWGNLGFRSPGVGLSASQDIRFDRVTNDDTEIDPSEGANWLNDETPAVTDQGTNCSSNYSKRKREVAMYPTEPGTWQEIEEWRRRVHVDYREVYEEYSHCQPPPTICSNTRVNTCDGNDNDGGDCSSAKATMTTADACLVLGFKATSFMFDLRWARVLQTHNPSVKFVVSLRKPSAWLRSFVRYRQTEVQGRAPWLLEALDAHPELLSITFADVALGGVDLLGADRNRGHFDRWLEPFIGFLYETNRQVKDALMVVFLEHMAADPLEAHTAVARFLDLDPKMHLPRHLHIVNGANTVLAFVAETNSNASASGQSREGITRGAKGSEKTISDSAKAQGSPQREKKESGSWWCIGITEADGPFDPSTGCRWVSDEPVLRALDDFYQPSMQRLNYLLQEHLDTPNPWWGVGDS